MKTSVEYGKAEVTVYRTNAAPLRGVVRIPESSFTGRDNLLFAVEVAVKVHGDAFLAAYTEGDNRSVVATDTMKNLIYELAAEYDGATLEGFLGFIGRRFLGLYPQMEWLEVRGSEVPFQAIGRSPGLLSAERGDRAVAEVEVARREEGPTVVAVRSGREGLRLVKLTGSSFTRFLRDEHTTLPETVDRPLFIHLDVHWRYVALADALGGAGYAHADQVRDLVAVVFGDFTSRSIQHLVHEMGRRVLERFPDLAEVSFAAQNRTWETARTAGAVKVYTDPHATYGTVGLVLKR